MDCQTGVKGGIWLYALKRRDILRFCGSKVYGAKLDAMEKGEGLRRQAH